MKLPENLEKMSSLSSDDLSSKEDNNITVGGIALEDAYVEESNEGLELEENKDDSLDTQEEMEQSALADKKGVPVGGGTLGANAKKAEMNKNYVGTMRKAAKDLFNKKIAKK